MRTSLISHDLFLAGWTRVDAADLDAAIAAWSLSEDPTTDYEVLIQVTIAARTSRNLVRWPFPT